MKKTHKKIIKTRSYARSIASNIWVLWQPPIGNVTPYFRGLVPYGSQARKATKPGKESHKARQGKPQSQVRKGTKAGKERHKGRQGKAQRQARKATKVDKVS